MKGAVNTIATVILGTALAAAGAQAETGDGAKKEKAASSKEESAAEAKKKKKDMANAKADDATKTANLDKTSEDGSAQAYVCEYQQHVRRVEVQYESPQQELPCEVHYKKKTEKPGHDQVLWSANNSASYCENKARSFVDKLEGWGWTCNGNSSM